MHRIFRVLALLLVCLLGTASSAWAQTAPPPAQIDEIEIVPGGSYSLIRVAVPNTYNLGSSDPDGLQGRIAETIRVCLTIAGYFDVYGPDRYFFDPAQEGMTASTINFANWFNVGAQGLVKTSFRIATNQASLDFRLYNVDTGQQIDIGYGPATVALDDVMAETYRFINQVILYYTGAPGIFGTSIAYVSRNEGGLKQIGVTSVDGLTMGSVTSNNSINVLPAWGPGGQIMYTSYVSGDPDLYVGSEPISTRPGLDMGASLSPDGGEIAVTLTMDGNSEVYILDTSGNVLRRCTDNPAEDLSPAWSPDGSQIAFVSSRSGGAHIFVMNRDCSGQRRITFAGSYNQTPDWSPLGDVIAFTGRDSRNRFDIFTVEPATGFIRRLTQDQGNNEEPSFSPDGRYLVFQSTRGGGGSRLYISTADGERQTLITPNGSGYEQPAWGGR
jgi:TolB protein